MSALKGIELIFALNYLEIKKAHFCSRAKRFNEDTFFPLHSPTFIP